MKNLAIDIFIFGFLLLTPGCKEELLQGVYLNSVGEILFYKNDSLIIFNPTFETLTSDPLPVQLELDYLSYCADMDNSSIKLYIHSQSNNSITLRSNDSCFNILNIARGPFTHFDLNEILWDSLVYYTKKEFTPLRLIRREEAESMQSQTCYMNLNEEIKLIASGRIDYALRNRSTFPDGRIRIYYKDYVTYENEIQDLPYLFVNLRYLQYSIYKSNNIE